MIIWQGFGIIKRILTCLLCLLCITTHTLAANWVEIMPGEFYDSQSVKKIKNSDGQISTSRWYQNWCTTEYKQRYNTKCSYIISKNIFNCKNRQRAIVAFYEYDINNKLSFSYVVSKTHIKYEKNYFR